MSETKAQLEAEKWICDTFLRDRFSIAFRKKKVMLSWGGEFEFDAVSVDGKIIGCISTSKKRMVRGGEGVGKVKKIIADAFYLLGAIDVEKRLLIFTESDMNAEFQSKIDAGRFPRNIDLILVETLPQEIRNKLERSRVKASEEFSPK